MATSTLDVLECGESDASSSRSNHIDGLDITKVADTVSHDLPGVVIWKLKIKIDSFCFPSDILTFLMTRTLDPCAPAPPTPPPIPPPPMLLPPKGSGAKDPAGANGALFMTDLAKLG